MLHCSGFFGRKKITGIHKGTNHTTGEDSVELRFFYDAQGKPMLMRYMDTDYAYLHNLQGDIVIVSMLDISVASVVDYAYDVCRIPTYTESSMSETLGADNPFRYRGGVRDGETGLYDLRSR